MTVRMSQPWTDPKGKRHKIGETPDFDERTEARLVEGGYAVPYDRAKAAKDDSKGNDGK